MKTDLLDRFVGFVGSHSIFSPDDPILLAISGGPDSLALTDLLSRMGQPITLAHCNFGLRGMESDQDEDFVRKIALVYDIPLRVKTFDTIGHARQMGISVEMAARELRYEWFEQVRSETGCKWVAVAHHADDSIETMLINLVRGTGLRGLCGIRPTQGNVIRPLLFTNRQEIIGYLEYRNLEYRTDSSNEDIRFHRNRIRNIVLPELEKINPSVRQTLRMEQEYLTGALGMMDEYIGAIRAEATVTRPGQILINLNRLRREKQVGTILFEILRPYGFNGIQAEAILNSASSGSGKLFHSRSHRLLTDRENLIVTEAADLPSVRYYFDPYHPDPDLPEGLTGRILEVAEFQRIDHPNRAFLDFDKLDFPLIIRRWEKGDFFYPLGMNHPKKLSDFFIDRKVDRMTKERTWILASGEQIVWVAGFRIDHRFRVTEETTRILELKIGETGN